MSNGNSWGRLAILFGVFILHHLPGTVFACDAVEADSDWNNTMTFETLEVINFYLNQPHLNPKNKNRKHFSF
jgi:hypothetical protein